MFFMENTGSKWFLILLALLLPILSFAQDAKEEKPKAQAEEIQKKEEARQGEQKKSGDAKSIEVQEVKQTDIHQKMLSKLNLIGAEEKESFLRRGEIVFFIAFGYTFMYQFIIYDQLMPGTFSEGSLKGELIDRNLGFAVITSLVIALLISRNDIQKQTYIKDGKNYAYSKAQLDKSFDRNKKGYNWYFNLFSWDF